LPAKINALKRLFLFPLPTFSVQKSNIQSESEVSDMKMFIGLFIFFVPLIAGVSLMESNYVGTGIPFFSAARSRPLGLGRPSI
jgi:hypothetical protein